MKSIYNFHIIVLSIVVLMSSQNLLSHNEDHYNKIWWYNKKAQNLPLKSLHSYFIESSFEKFDLSGLTFLDYLLSEVNLKHSNFNNATIDLGNFCNTDLQHIQGEDLKIMGANFSRAKFQHASLRRMKVTGGLKVEIEYHEPRELFTGSMATTSKTTHLTEVRASFEEANFDYADLEKSTFVGVDKPHFDNINFRKACFRGAVLIGSNLTKEILLASECDITDAIFNEDIVDAVSCGSLYKTDFLLKRGINPNTTNSDGKLAVYIALKKGFDDIAVLLINKGQTLPPADDEGMTWLHHVAKNNLNKALAAGLLLNKEQVNTKDNSGNTPMHYASLNGNASMIETLHKAGASLNEKNNEGLTPMHVGVMNKKTTSIESLAQLGAPKNIKTPSGFSEVHLAFQHKSESLVPVLSKHKFDLDALSDAGETAVHMATQKGEKQYVKLLKDNGARLDIRDKAGKLPVFWSIKARRDSLSKLLEINNEKPTFKDVLGIDPLALAQIKSIITYMKDPYKFKLKGAPQPNRILLVGPSGTGKTLIARALSNEANCAFIERAGSSFIERWVGAPAENIKKFFKEARKKRPCICFIDEFDAIAGHRKDPKESGTSATDNHNQMIDQLLCDTEGFNEYDGLIVVGATNHIKNIDKAVRSRFKTQVEIPLPKEKGRVEILKHFINTLPCINFGDDFITHLAQITGGFSGRRLKALVTGAALISAVKDEGDPVTIEDFMQSLTQLTQFDDEKESD